MNKANIQKVHLLYLINITIIITAFHSFLHVDGYKTIHRHTCTYKTCIQKAVREDMSIKRQQNITCSD